MKDFKYAHLVYFLLILGCTHVQPAREKLQGSRQVAASDLRCSDLLEELASSSVEKAGQGLKLSDVKNLLGKQRYQEAAWMAAHIGQKDLSEQIEQQIAAVLEKGKIVGKIEPIEEFIETASEVYIVKFEDGLKGVFKPRAEYWKEKHPYNGIIANPKSEVVAYKLSRELNLGMVPVTTLKTIDGMEGSVQAFVDFNSQLTYTFLESQTPEMMSFSQRMVYDPIRRQEQILKLFDYLIFNTDRRSGNKGRWYGYARYPEGLSPGQGVGLVAFDNGAAFQVQKKAQGNFPPTAPVSLEIPASHVEDFLTSLKTELTEEKIIKNMKDYFSEEIIQEVIQRRKIILNHFGF